MNRDYYVTMRRGEVKIRVAFLVGPFRTHDEALALVDAARAEAERIDPWTVFDAFGTSSLPANIGNPYGKLNQRMGVVARVPA